MWEFPDPNIIPRLKKIDSDVCESEGTKSKTAGWTNLLNHIQTKHPKYRNEVKKITKLWNDKLFNPEA